jgi:hypothetical protein
MEPVADFPEARNICLIIKRDIAQNRFRRGHTKPETLAQTPGTPRYR